MHHINVKAFENRGVDLSWVIALNLPYNWDPHVVKSLFVCTLDPTGRPCNKDNVAIHAPQVREGEGCLFATSIATLK